MNNPPVSKERAIGFLTQLTLICDQYNLYPDDGTSFYDDQSRPVLLGLGWEKPVYQSHGEEIKSPGFAAYYVGDTAE